MDTEFPLRIAFFGTPEFAAIICDTLCASGFSPCVIITAPPAPKGRKLVLTKSDVHLFGEKNNIPILTPTTLRTDEALEEIRALSCDLFIVAAYGKIIPKNILDIPSHGTLNVHPSLLPKFRGASPIESAILSDDKKTGVTIMVLDEEVDHGPIVATKEYLTNDWPPHGSTLTRALAREGGNLLADVIKKWVKTHEAKEQDHAQATFTKKIAKTDGLIDFADNPYTNYKKIRAFDEWPGTYFFITHKGKPMRVRINDAHFAEGVLTLLSVTPEGRGQMSYKDFIRGFSEA
jgi:methionyl-tRNA formyltransferase